MTASDISSELRFEPPGPGPWALDPVHFPRPMTRYFQETQPPSFKRGTNDFARFYGMLIDGLEMAYVNGFGYRQVLPGLDLSPSIGLGYTKGKSSAVGPGFGVDGGGDLSLGLNAVYLGSWNLAINYVHFLGKAAPTLDAANNAVYRQALKDRNYLTVSLRTTF